MNLLQRRKDHEICSVSRPVLCKEGAKRLRNLINFTSLYKLQTVLQYQPNSSKVDQISAFLRPPYRKQVLKPRVSALVVLPNGILIAIAVK